MNIHVRAAEGNLAAGYHLAGYPVAPFDDLYGSRVCVSSAQQDIIFLRTLDGHGTMGKMPVDLYHK